MTNIELTHTERTTRALETIAAQLTRQADVMAADVASDVINNTVITGVALEKVHLLGIDLEKIVTATYHNDMHRAKAIRGFIEMLKNFDLTVSNDLGVL